MVLPEDLSEKLLLVLVVTRGLETAGERALRKSVYAVGGVIGVLMSSCLIWSAQPGNGLRGSSDGRVADRGVAD